MKQLQGLAETADCRLRAPRAQAAVELPPEVQPLFETLREKRLELARAQGVPSYVVLHDRTLAEMAGARPASKEALARISGVGTGKLERYGAAFLAVIAEHLAEA